MNFKVELLNVLLQRLIGEMIYMPACDEVEKTLPINNLQDSVLKITVFPNPTAGTITIESSKQIKQIFITDFTGKILQKIDAQNKRRRWQINLSMYPSATYLVKYFNEEKGWGVVKVV